MTTPLRLLMVEDQPEQAQLLVLMLHRAGFELTWQRAGTEQEYLARLDAGLDIILSEYALPQFSALDALRLLRERGLDIPVILVCGIVDEDAALAALQKGAADYLFKDRLGRLGPAVKRALAQRQAREETRQGEQQLPFRAALRDLSERQRGDEAVATLAAIVSSSDMAIIGADLEGRITTWNPGAEHLYGYGQGEVIGQSVTTLVPPDRQEEIRAILTRVQRGEQVPAFDTVRLHKKGNFIDVSLSVAPIRDREGRVVGASTMLYDIRERRLLEEQLRQSQKLEAVGRLAGGVAHDFNNLLQVITGYGSLLLGQLPAGDPNRELVQEMTTAGDRAASLTRQLLAFSRRQIVAPQLLDLKTIITDTEKMLRRVIGEDVDLVTASDADLGPVRADAGQIIQVLMNLAVNARDAMPKGGNLTVELRNMELDESYARAHTGVKAGMYVLLAVSDTGVGIDRTTLAKIWEPFFTTKGPGVGTGLGLAVVHGILQQAGGHAQVYSEVGHGTTFKLYFPRAGERPASDKSYAGMKVLPQGTETVLLAEDEDSVRALMRHVLQSCGYTVLEARDGEEALRLAAHHKGPLSLLVTDVVMPRGSGGELAEELIRQRPGLKVLYLSGYTDDAVVRHGVLSPEVAFLQKPFSVVALALKVRDVLDCRLP